MAATADKVESTRDDALYLPDFCSARVALAIVLISELLAIVMTLARRDLSTGFWLDLARASLFLLWIGLASAWVLCVARSRLRGYSAPQITLVSFLLLVGVVAVISEVTFWLGAYTLTPFASPGQSFFPQHHLGFVLSNLGISAIVIALVLRYFYVAHQWRTNVEMEARSRVSALHARIRPHFLFNSMNTIAALTRSQPEKAEQAVEDLADLFRVSLGEAGTKIPLKEELEIARIYQRIEQLRLGERLEVRWNVSELPMRALVPSLTLQPLLENAIYHGIEPSPGGGTVIVDGCWNNGMIELSVTNPIAGGGERRHSGNRMALANIRERLTLAYGTLARVDIESDEQRYRVSLTLPHQESGV